MVKALDLSSNVRMHTWVRTPFLVEWDPGDASFFPSLLRFSVLQLPFVGSRHTFSLFFLHCSCANIFFFFGDAGEIKGHSHSNL